MTAEQSRILQLDPASGASGDMFLGALVSLGVPLTVITGAVEKVIPGEVAITESQVTRGGIAATRCEVKVKGGPGRRDLAGMKRLINDAGLPDDIRQKSMEVLAAIGDAEARVHGIKEGPVHLHELGGQDTLADVVGTVAGFAHLGAARVVCGPVNLGSGTVKTEHGTLPVPAPATAELLSGIPVFSAGPAVELTTPTGAALIRCMCHDHGSIPLMTLTGTGYGAGGRDNTGMPNVLRILSGEEGRLSGGSSVIIECGIDDVSPEYIAPLVDLLHGEGAREVHVIPAHTKKGRVGILLRVLSPLDLVDHLVKQVLDSSGSSGLRYWRVDRAVCHRETLTVDTGYGQVRIKRWKTPSGRWRAKPEFEDVREVSVNSGVPADEVRDLAMARYLSEEKDGFCED
jgi:uncharacterized protein (TIGR00299 family) protein